MLCTRTIFISLLLTLPTYADILVNHVRPSCNHSLPESHQGCLRGQTCLQDNTCEKNYGPSIHARQSVPKTRSDGRCGPDFDDARCWANGPSGTCCSLDGWCNNGTQDCIEPYTLASLLGDRAMYRPANIKLSRLEVSAQADIDIDFTCSAKATTIKVALYHGGFVTHSPDMNQWMIRLDTVGFHAGSPTQKVTASMPGNANLTPPGAYLVYVVVDGILGAGQPITILANDPAVVTDSLDETQTSQASLGDPASTTPSPSFDTPYNAASDMSKAPRVFSPDPQTAHVERPQGGISPPKFPRQAEKDCTTPTSPSQLSSTKQNSASHLPASDMTSIPVPSKHERFEIPRPSPQTARVAQNNGQDLTGAQPGNGHPPAPPAEHVVASTTTITIPAVHERLKIPRPLPQTARMAQNGQDLSGPQPGDGHPPATVDRRDEADPFESSATESGANSMDTFFAMALMTVVVVIGLL